jgi:hypothetical protein
VVDEQPAEDRSGGDAEGGDPAPDADRLRRSVSSKTCTRIERVPGIRNAPPTPISPRQAMSAVAVSANAAATEAPPKRARPSSRPFLRPNRSDSDPAVSSRPAKTSE